VSVITLLADLTLPTDLTQPTDLTLPVSTLCTLYQRSIQELHRALLTLLLLLSAGLTAAETTPEQNCLQRFDKSALYTLDSLKQSYTKANINGKIIRQINIYRLTVFDESNPDENNWLYRFLNKVHIKTRDSVVRNLLLFKTGEHAETALLEETERILRSQGSLADALIIPEQFCDGEVILAVITRDTWALEIDAGFSEEGNETQTTLGLRSTNLFGSGDLAMITYKSAPDRNKVRYQYSSPHLFGSRYQTNLYHSANSDGTENAFSLTRPFYALSTPLAFGLSLWENSQIKVLKALDVVQNQFREAEGEYRLFAGFSPGLQHNFSHRFSLGLTRESNTFSESRTFVVTDDSETTTDTLTLPEESIRNYPWLAYQRIENRFGKFRNINQIQKTEDISLGQRLYAAIGYGAKTFNRGDSFVDIKSSYSDVISLGDHHITHFSFGLNGKVQLNPHRSENLLLSTSIAHNHYISERQRWYTRWRFDKGYGLSESEQLSFEDNHILRGYPTSYQYGDRRIIGSLEHRVFYNYHIINLFRLGQVAFFDLGRAWNRDNAKQSPVLTDIGFGLRISSTKARINNVIHADIALPLNDRDVVDSYQLTIKTQYHF
jgi:outer membrane protein assembly factor BamA